MPFTTGLPLATKERPEPTLRSALSRFEAAIARRRYKRGLHQSYLTRATPQTEALGKRITGDRDAD